MKELWYCFVANKTSGPFTDEELKRLASEGRLRPEDLICRGLQGQWQPAGGLAGLFDAAQAGAGDSSGQRADGQALPQPGDSSVTATSSASPAASSPSDSAKERLKVAKPLPPAKPKTPTAAKPAPPIRQSNGNSGVNMAAPRPQPRPACAAPVRGDSAIHAPAGSGGAIPVVSGHVTPVPVAPAPVVPTVVPTTGPTASGAVVRPATTAAEAAASTHIQHLRDRRRKRTSGLITSVVTATVAAVLLGVIALISTSMNKKNPELAKGKSSQRPAQSKTPKRRKAGDTGALVAQDVDRAVEAISKLTPSEIARGIKQWREPTYSPTVGEFMVTLTDVWLVDNKLHANVQITNKSQRHPRTLTTWNNLGSRHECAGALLVNGSGDVLTLTPHPQDINMTEVVIQPGETVTETLVFTSPVDVSEVRLILPFTIFGRSGEYGFVVPGDKIAAQAPANVATVNVANTTRKKTDEGRDPKIDPGAAALNDGKQPKAANTPPATKTIPSTVGQMPDRGLFSKKADGGDPRTPKTIEGLKNAIERARVKK